MRWARKLGAKVKQVAPDADREYEVPSTPSQTSVAGPSTPSTGSSSRGQSSPWHATTFGAKLRKTSIRLSLGFPGGHALPGSSFRRKQQNTVSHHEGRRKLLTLAQEIVDAISSESLEQVGEHIDALSQCYTTVCGDLRIATRKGAAQPSRLHRPPSVLASGGDPLCTEASGGGRDRSARGSKESATGMPDGASPNTREQRRLMRRSGEEAREKPKASPAEGRSRRMSVSALTRQQTGLQPGSRSPALSRSQTYNISSRRLSAILDPHALVLASASASTSDASIDNPQVARYDPATTIQLVPTTSLLAPPSSDRAPTPRALVRQVRPGHLGDHRLPHRPRRHHVPPGGSASGRGGVLLVAGGEWHAARLPLKHRRQELERRAEEIPHGTPRGALVNCGLTGGLYLDACLTRLDACLTRLDACLTRLDAWLTSPLTPPPRVWTAALRASGR